MSGPFENVENLVLGGGEAGKYIAWELAKQGRPVLVVERALIGGACPNVACLPSKNVIRTAQVVHLTRRAAEYGVHVPPAPTDMEVVLRRKRTMVAGMIEIHEKRFAAPGIEFVLGEGRFTAPRTLEIRLAAGGTRIVGAERVFLNLGTRAAIPDIPGLAAAVPMTHVEALELDRLPPHLLVLGGGYVGVELAQAFRRFGSRVTVVELGSQLLGREDADVAEAVREMLAAEGVDVVLGAEVRAVQGRSGNGVTLVLGSGPGERAIEGSDLLVAAGRKPNTEGIGLELAGIELDPRGYVMVDEHLRTRAERVWAMGECAGSPQFTHAAFDDFRVVRDGLAGIERTTRDRLIPYCVFTDPELGRVGLSEADARRMGTPARVQRLPMSSVLRARAIGETRGFMKAVLDGSSDRILGFTMLGHGAGEVIAVVQMAMLAGTPYTALRDAILTHPTMVEGLNVLFATAPIDVE
ncbi:MAG: FAD-dependent oxidoreductase [Gemmatimonadales bacterium]